MCIGSFILTPQLARLVWFLPLPDTAGSQKTPAFDRLVGFERSSLLELISDSSKLVVSGQVLIAGAEVDSRIKLVRKRDAAEGAVYFHSSEAGS